MATPMDEGTKKQCDAALENQYISQEEHDLLVEGNGTRIERSRYKAIRHAIPGTLVDLHWYLMTLPFTVD